MIPRFCRCVPYLIVPFCVWAVTGCYDPDAAVPSLEDVRAEQMPDQESWLIRFDVLDGEQPRVQIYAGHSAKYETSDSTYTVLTALPDDEGQFVKAFMFDEQGDSSATITARELVYHEVDRRFEAKGEVVVLTRDDKRLETEYLVWLEVDRRLYTSGFVRITSPVENIQGYDLKADESLENYEIARVTGQVVVDDL